MLLALCGCVVVGGIVLALQTQRWFPSLGDADGHLVRTVVKQTGARRDLVEMRARELRIFPVSENQREDLLLHYANATIDAKKLAQQARNFVISDELLTAIADAIVIGGGSEDILQILTKTRGEARIIALSRFYVLMRRGETSPTAAALVFET